MLTAKFWARGAVVVRRPNDTELSVSCRGWSNESLDDAEVQAKKRAEAIASRVSKNERSGDRYGYGDRPLPEPVNEEITGADGVIALITTNSYGAEILNTKDLVIVDIDGKVDKPSFWSSFTRMFGAKPSNKFGEIGSSVERYLSSSGVDAGVRLYRTKAGNRLIITNARIDPTTATPLLEQFDADRLYVKLCGAQKSYRARLTPKPWRCGFYVPPVTFPFVGTTAQGRFDDWCNDYKEVCKDYATCELLHVFGKNDRDRDYQDLIKRHDKATKAESGLPLA